MLGGIGDIGNLGMASIAKIGELPGVESKTTKEWLEYRKTAYSNRKDRRLEVKIDKEVADHTDALLAGLGKGVSGLTSLT